ncbi:MAG TPA: outer membrane protein assembly factor BamD, partial [Bacteroidetes bacterium]|nr:outer membrane protein assembly factor BamD [Bacteroidota bacterium]
DPYQLDQKYTHKSIDQYQLFLSRYPDAKEKEKCVSALEELRERLAFKAFEQAHLYYKIGYHKAAVQAFGNMIREYPDSKFREEAQYLLFRASVNLAKASIYSRKIVRYDEAAEFHEKFADKFPESKFAKDAQSELASANKTRARLKKDAAEKQQLGLYSSFKSSIGVVLKSKDLENRRKEYAKALDTYNELKDKYPKSEYLSQADKLFQEVEEKQENNE